MSHAQARAHGRLTVVLVITFLAAALQVSYVLAARRNPYFA